MEIILLYCIKKYETLEIIILCIFTFGKLNINLCNFTLETENIKNYNSSIFTLKTENIKNYKLSIFYIGNRKT